MKKSTLGMFAAAFTGIALSVSGFAAGLDASCGTNCPVGKRLG
jgi:hypothetical protein